MTPFNVRLTFHGDLPLFLRSKRGPVERRLTERTSIKDIVEACGVPHTEVDLILVDSQPVDFSRVLRSEAVIEVFPIYLKPRTSF